MNVVIYRLPRERSLVTPPSACPACGKRIRFYDNIPLLSWLVLAGKCRNCKAKISIRYFLVELLTGAVFTGLFTLYFYSHFRAGILPVADGGWLIYLLHIILLAALIAASGIDMEFWIIPLCVCWFITVVGLAGATVCSFVLNTETIEGYHLIYSASADTASAAAGAGLGLILSLLFLTTGFIKRSYESDIPEEQADNETKSQINHRIEACREILFLLPIIVCSAVFFLLNRRVELIGQFWASVSQIQPLAGFLGGVWGYFIGCGIVWATRILGTLGFGKEAMGLGDVHLMGAAGVIIGPVSVVIAFFIAPFFGLIWASGVMFFKKIRQIPYGPFLSLAIFAVMILHDWIFSFLFNVLQG
ncbi:prepilin peptidase [Planctomycetota bacterium]